jgi:hypothetical protein
MSLILVATTSTNPTGKRVERILRNKGCDTIFMAIDEIARGKAEFSCDFGNGAASLTYNKRSCDLDEIGGAWDWHVNVFHIDERRQKPLAVLREMQHTFSGLFNCINQNVWLNPPYLIRNTQEKISQMVFAQDCGLRIPRTVLSTKWDDIQKLGDRSILKMPVSGMIDDNSKVLYTTVLDEKQRSRLRHTSPFPGIHQAYISKKREWRITIVGEKVFPAAIYTEADAKDDWRKHQHSNDHVTFKDEPLPDPAIGLKCNTMLKKLGLRYGAFDFIETPDGEMVFLEVNSAGQYGWLEDQLGLPISEAIADLLIEIADAHVHR